VKSHPLLLLALALLTGFNQSFAKPKPTDTLKVRIFYNGWEDRDPPSYIEGEPIWVRCSIVNIGKRPQMVKLKDHDSYYGTLAYPYGIAVKVLDSSQQLLTNNEIDKSGSGWWSSYYSWSNTISFMPGDIITIPPSEEVIRRIPIDKVAAGCSGVKFKPGRYTIQLRVDNHLSDFLEIQIVSPK